MRSVEAICLWHEDYLRKRMAVSMFWTQFNRVAADLGIKHPATEIREEDFRKVLEAMRYRWGGEKDQL